MLQRPRRRCEGTAMGAIVLDLRPGLGIGPFSLGNHIYKFVPVQDRILLAQRIDSILIRPVKFCLLLLNFTTNGRPRGSQAVAIAFPSLQFRKTTLQGYTNIQGIGSSMYIPLVCGLPHNQMFSYLEPDFTRTTLADRTTYFQRTDRQSVKWAQEIMNM